MPTAGRAEQGIRAILGSGPASFAELTRPVFEEIRIGRGRIATLVAVCDSLLPKLISRKLRLPNRMDQLEGTRSLIHASQSCSVEL